MSSEIDWSRIYELGKISHEKLLSIYRISSVHVYLTYPFVLSWSLLEAMSCGCLVVGSKTTPVQEVIEDRKNGFLVDFSDSKGLADQCIRCLKNQEEYKNLRNEARKTILERFELKSCIRSQLALIDFVATNKIIADG